ncbi:MAG: two-component system, NtrC family, sensor kinase [Pseudomonadota bacterium]|nr:two-component system, NtrC family, sensor kinase [Pseudomonadota bacterium]
MHPRLEKQWRRHLGERTVPDDWQDFIAAVGTSYEQADFELKLSNHTLGVMSEELTERNQVLESERDEQKALVKRLEEAHNQLLQSEKMASIGQLAAGVAHEINNPIGYVNSNLQSLGSYVNDLLRVIDAAAVAEMAPDARASFEAVCHEVDLDYLREDLAAMLAESREGIDRVRNIVQDLKDFSHADEGKFAWADLHHGIDSTLNIVANEVKYKADVVKEYGTLPQVMCSASQLNQVFMNLLVNAAHAMPADRRGHITIRTRLEDGQVVLEFTDDGSGIAPENLKRIFDPFFTTKPVGKGTGLGLSLSYGIIEKHGGRITVESTVGVGTTFRITLPVGRIDIGSDDSA